jgi:hypothetical protein
LYFWGYQRERKRGTGLVIFVLSVLTKGKRRGVQDRSYLYFLGLPKGKEDGYRTGHLCTFCSYQREKKRGTGQFIFVLSFLTKEKGRGVQDMSSLYFLWLPKGKEEGYITGQVIFVLSVVTKGKGRGVQDKSFLYFLWLPKGKEDGYRTGHLCTFCSYHKERKRDTGQIIFVLSVVTEGKGRGVQDRSSLYFLWLSMRKEEGYMTGHLCTFCGYQFGKGRGAQDRPSLYFLWLPKGKEEGYSTEQVIFVLSLVTKGKGRGVQDRSSLYFL